jgi:hypothetical protein
MLEPGMGEIGELPPLVGAGSRGRCRLRHHHHEMLDTTQSDTAPPPEEPRGCLFALSQPPLMIFLAVIGSLLLMAALHDLLLL